MKLVYGSILILFISLTLSYFMASNQSDNNTHQEIGGFSVDSELKDNVMGSKLLVFGATGPTGELFVKRALQLGHTVTVVARTPEKFALKPHERLHVVQGDATNLSSFESHVKGHSAVISAIGVHGSSPWNKTKLYSLTITNIIEAMKNANVNRLVCITSWATSKEQKDGAPFWGQICKSTIIAGFIHDMRLMEEIIEKESNSINYTIVRPPGLGNISPTQVPDNIKLPEDLSNYLIQSRLIAGKHTTFLKNAKLLSLWRGLVADFMLHCLYTKEYDRTMVSIGLPK